jgi:hypothetical protein
MQYRNLTGPLSAMMLPQPQTVFAPMQRTAESQHIWWSVWTKTPSHKSLAKYGGFSL